MMIIHPPLLFHAEPYFFPFGQHLLLTAGAPCLNPLAPKTFHYALLMGLPPFESAAFTTCFEDDGGGQEGNLCLFGQGLIGSFRSCCCWSIVASCLPGSSHRHVSFPVCKSRLIDPSAYRPAVAVDEAVRRESRDLLASSPKQQRPEENGRKFGFVRAIGVDTQSAAAGSIRHQLCT